MRRTGARPICNQFGGIPGSGGTDCAKTQSQFILGNEERNSGDLPRYYFLKLVCDQILTEGITGDYAGLGVYKGNTAALLADLARRTGSRAYLLDTFKEFASDDLVEIDKNIKIEFVDTAAISKMHSAQNVAAVDGRGGNSASRSGRGGILEKYHRPGFGGSAISPITRRNSARFTTDVAPDSLLSPWAVRVHTTLSSRGRGRAVDRDRIR